MDKEPRIDIEVLLGRAEIETRDVWVSREQLECQGRSLHYDRNGVCTKVTEWEPISRMTYPEATPPRPWWMFWRR